MHLTIVTGSHRLDSESLKVGRYLGQHWSQLHPDSTNSLIDLAQTPLPLWDGQHQDATSNSGKAWGKMVPMLQSADAFVIVAPEWGGMAPAALKNFFLFASSAELGHKPALLVSVSAGISGAYPIAELRSSSYKNNHICYIPEHLIVRQVGNVLNSQDASSPEDQAIRNRADFALNILAAYAKALQPVRASGITQNKAYPFGM
jgi:NAD(P)H-dependent FMN reductase